MPMNPYQYQQPGAFPYVPGYQAPTMQQMVGQGYSSTPSFHPHPGITGRVVNSLDEITVQEVPTDGTVAWFPSADGSCVYGKRWTPDGNITTMRYVPEATEAAPSQPDPFQLINARIDELVDLVEDISDNMPRPAETKRTQQTTKRRAVKTDAE